MTPTSTGYNFSMKTPFFSIKRTVRWLCILALAVGIAVFGWAGSFSRLWADDYCYSSTLQQFGLWQGVGEWYNESGSRISALPVVGLVDLAGVWGVRLFPLAVMLLWVLAGWVLLRAAAERLNMKPGRGWLLFFSLLLTFFTAYLAPDRLQTVYWRMGIIHYSLPVPFFLLLAGWILRARSDLPAGRRILRGLGVVGLAGWIGGLSETFAALQAGACLLALAGFALAKGRKNWTAILLTGLALLGSVGAMGVMALSPSNAWRQAALPPPDSLLQLVQYTLRYSLDFMRYSLLDQPLPNVVFAGMAFLGAWLGLENDSFPARNLWWAMAGAVLVMFALIACSVAPSVYGGLAYPSGRALMPARLIWLAGLGTLAGLGAQVARTWLARWRWTRWAVPALLLVLLLYPLRSAWIVGGAETQALSVRAERWDARHAQIISQREAGITAIEIAQVDVVQGLEDIGPDSEHWVNQCAAGYYGVELMQAGE